MRRLSKLVLLAIAALMLAVAWGLYSYSAPGPLAAPKTLIFSKGAGVQGIARQLAQEGVVSHVISFKAAALFSGKAGHFKAGEYAFPAGISMQDIIALLASGKVVIHKVTVAEGLTVREVAALLAAEPQLTGAVPANIAEGSLLPETYYFTYGDTRADVIGRMQKGMQAALIAAWAKRAPNLPFNTPQEALTLASIVEKETGVPDERAHVASVYINRLRKGMLLQADPTVTYGIEQAENAEMKRPLTTADLQTPSPYNTYMHPGLPPTPIANPGRAAIEATLSPMETNDLYFVATGTGGHRFAATLAEHAKNVAEYRKTMRQQKAALP